MSYQQDEFGSHQREAGADCYQACGLRAGRGASAVRPARPDSAEWGGPSRPASAMTSSGCCVWRARFAHALRKAPRRLQRSMQCDARQSTSHRAACCDSHHSTTPAPGCLVLTAPAGCVTREARSAVPARLRTDARRNSSAALLAGYEPAAGALRSGAGDADVQRADSATSSRDSEVRRAVNRAAVLPRLLPQSAAGGRPRAGSSRAEPWAERGNTLVPSALLHCRAASAGTPGGLRLRRGSAP